MIIRTKNNKRKWQRKFIKRIFDYSHDKKKYFSKIVLKNVNLINEKNEKLPRYLFKYYSPTSENILDIKNQRLWFSNPKSFNDPFDCNIGYDNEKFEKSCLVQFVDENGCVEDSEKVNGFTIDDKSRIQRSRLGDGVYWDRTIENYSSVKWKILSSKSTDFQQKVYVFLTTKSQQLDVKIEKLKDIDIRIACFSEFDKYDEFLKQVVMWSHYADNHKGFCVEYDLEFLKKDIQFSLNDYDYLTDKVKYLEERNEAIIKAGLFPIEYTSSRINIPITKLNQLNIDSEGKINYNSNIDELIYKTFIVKSANWNYEKEWRIIIDGQICNYYNNKIPFPYIKTIYLGCKAENELIEMMIGIGEDIGAEVVLLKMDAKKFVFEKGRTSLFKFENERRRWDNPFNN